MNIFGRTFETQEIVALVGLLMVLVLWVMRWKGDREWAHWFRNWEAERKARRDAEIRAEGGNPDPEASNGSSPDHKSGPWG